MKRILLLSRAALLLCGFLVAGNLRAQTADEIVAKYVDALGGTAKLASLNTVRMTGNITAQGMDFPLVITKAQGRGMRLDLNAMGTSYYQFATPDAGQIFMPGMTEAKAMEPAMLQSFGAQMDVQGPLYNYKVKGNTVEFVDKEKLNGADVYKLKVTLKSGKVIYYFIDAATNRAVQTETTANVNGQDMDIISGYSDYRQNADGYWFPYSYSSANGPVTYDKIETNVKVEDGVFKQ